MSKKYIKIPYEDTVGYSPDVEGDSCIKRYEAGSNGYMHHAGEQAYMGEDLMTMLEKFIVEEDEPLLEQVREEAKPQPESFVMSTLPPMDDLRETFKAIGEMARGIRS